MGVRRGGQRVTLREAALLLGVSKDAIRQRIRRGTMRSEKGGDGRVYVYVDASPDDVRGDHARQQDVDAARVHELRERVAFLERELERKDAILLNMTKAMKAIAPPVHEEPPPQEEPYSAAAPREYAVTPTPQPGRVGPQTEVGAAQEPAEPPEMPADEQQGRGPVSVAEGAQEDTEQPRRRSWWREFFGFD